MGENGRGGTIYMLKVTIQTQLPRHPKAPVQTLGNRFPSPILTLVPMDYKVCVVNIDQGSRVSGCGKRLALSIYPHVASQLNS